MTIREIIESLNNPNALSDKEKIRRLSELDVQIYEDIIQRHEGAEVYMVDNGDGTYSERVFPYTEDSQQLIAPQRFSKMYEAYLRAEIALRNDELDRYANELQLFQSAYSSFNAWYNETHMPIHNAKITVAPAYRRRHHDADPFSRV